MKYSIVIPTYNHCDDLLKPCIESLLTYSSVADIELIISANGCRDQTAEYLEALREKFNYLGLGPNFKTVWSPVPVGFAKAINAGIRVATCDKIVLLNNDVIIQDQPKNHWLNLFDTSFLVPNVGISTIILQYSEVTAREFAIFFCVMIKRQVIDTIGLLSEDYGSGGYEDTDYCIRAEQAGFKIHQPVKMAFSPEENINLGDFPVYHKAEGTVHDTSLVPDYSITFAANRFTLAKKFNPSWFDLHKKDATLYWVREQDPDIYKEIVEMNQYKLTPEKMQGRNVIDVGANIGVFSLLAAALGAEKVIAIEPASSTYAKLVSNVTIADFGTIVPMQNLVSNVDGALIELGLNDTCTHNSMYNTSPQASEPIPTISLPTILSHFDGGDIFMKLDCEGAEYDILMNASEQDMARVSELVLEIHSELHPTIKGLQVIEDKIRSFGFTQLVSDQLYFWNVDEFGNKINWRPLPLCIQYWKR